MSAATAAAFGIDAAIDAVHAATALYTAEPVVEAILSESDWPANGGTLCDPSCGDGAFLAGAIRALIKAEPDIEAEVLCRRVQGWELHPRAAQEARSRVAKVLLERGGFTQAESMAMRIVRQADFLLSGPDTPTYLSIVGNPPYLRYTKIAKELSGPYRARLPGYACHDLAFSFLEKCARSLLKGGDCRLVTADRWLAAEGAMELRQRLGNRMSLTAVERLDASTAFYRPKYRVRGTPPRVHPVVVHLRAADVATDFRLDGSAIYPGAGITHTCGQTLGDMAQVKLAPWLGTRGVFLVDAAAANALPKGCTVPAVESGDYKKGKLEIGRYALITDRDEPPAEILGHLDRELPRMCERGRRSPRWLPPEPWLEKFDLSKPSLMVARVARRLQAIRIPPGVLPTNHCLVLSPRRGFEIDQVVEVVESDAAHEWIRLRAPRLEDGYFGVPARLLRQLPAP